MVVSAILFAANSQWRGSKVKEINNRRIISLNKQNKKSYMKGLNKNKQDLDSENTWSNVIKIVENANLQQAQTIRWKSSSRKMMYRNQLDMQIQEHSKNIEATKKQKNRERTEVEQQANKQRSTFFETKIKKIKTEQKYRAQNLQLSKLHNLKTDNSQRYGEHPFVTLVDKQDQRLRQTKMNFRLQNKLNDIQVAIHKQKALEKSNQQKKIGQQFESYIENQYKKQQQSRQNFKDKYLSIKKWQGETNQCEEMQKSSNLQRKYVNFLDHQVSELKKRKSLQKELLRNQEVKLNRHVDVADSSPAYLGRIPYSNDRKKQLEIIDSKLYPLSLHRYRAGSELYHSIDIDERRNSPDEQKRPKSKLQVLPLIGKGKSQQMYRQSGPNPQGKSISLGNSMIRIQMPKQREKRSYISYDVISGSRKNVII